ncbi:MAG: hypothetical protein DRG33_00305 [Deltaproteobacteria bacterium]|nr:MAG: hypothetical protein DRG33_00305 [Deltaproteobacteria bacterium]
MRILRDTFEASDFHHPVVTIGSYDGLHLGHQAIIKKVIKEAKEKGGESVVFTFEPHPVKVLHPHWDVPLITPYSKKILLLKEMGVDTVINYPFDQRLAKLSPEAFVEEVIYRRLRPLKVIVGYNFTFGRGKGGTAEDLREMGAAMGFEVEVIPPFEVEGKPVSSSRIRELVRQGRIEEANRLLGRDFIIMGEVVPGTGRGRKLGFPTANLRTEQELLPPKGVYAARAYVGSRGPHPAVVNIGTRPTFGEGDLVIEAFLPGFHGDLYGQELRLGFLRRLRDERPFSSPEALKEQISRDVEETLRLLQVKGEEQ